MKRIRIMGLCALAVFAFSAVAAATASAAPVLLHEFALCVKAAKVGKTYVGHYTAKGCAGPAVETGGKYERASAIGDKGTSKSKTSTLYSYIPKSEAEPWTGGTVVGTVSCKKSAGVTEVISAMSESSKINFEDCTSEGKKCTSPSNTVGDIATNLLTATLQLEAGKVVSVATPAAGPEAPDAEFNCEGLAVVTLGSSIGELSGNVEKASKTSKDTLTVNSKTGEPGISFYEGPESGEQNLALLLSHITPPGITLPSGENTTQELKGGEIGVFAA
jgi:hypothetical protein